MTVKRGRSGCGRGDTNRSTWPLHILWSPSAPVEPDMVHSLARLPEPRLVESLDHGLRYLPGSCLYEQPPSRAGEDPRAEGAGKRRRCGTVLQPKLTPCLSHLLAVILTAASAGKDRTAEHLCGVYSTLTLQMPCGLGSSGFSDEEDAMGRTQDAGHLEG